MAETTTTRGQRIAIWIIALILTVGTIGSFIMIALANNNQAIDDAASEQSYQEQLAAYEQMIKEQAVANAANSQALDGYSVSTFDSASVTQLGVEVLSSGTGIEVKETDTIRASYFGWLSDGTIFDSSYKKDAGGDSPLEFSLMQVIEGWTEGIAGQRTGSVVRLTIPSGLGYGATGSGIIPANAPLQFIVIIHDVVSA